MKTRLTPNRPLYEIGFALHLLRPRSKVPVDSGWTKGERAAWDDLVRRYSRGSNVGVRLGAPSKVGEGYLAVIDCDVKSSDPAHVAEMEKRLGEFFSGKAPTVLSGRGNGSRHVYVLTRAPARAKRLAQSPEKVKVHMPSSGVPSKFERENLSSEEIEAGYRLRAAWEISLMGDGQQVVLPPSIHPDTGSAYAWESAIRSVRDLPLFTIPEGKGGAKAASDEGSIAGSFKPVAVDLVTANLPDHVYEAIVSGEGVEDRSGKLLGVCCSLLKAGFSDAEILTVLTDRENFLGETGYDHAKTDSRARAAEWVRKYSLEPAKRKTLAEEVFKAEVEVLPVMSEDEARIALAESAPESEDWRDRLKRGGQDGNGPPKALVENIVLILTNAVSPEVFLHDAFALREFYGVDTPWGGKKGVSLADKDGSLISYWLGQNYHFEPSKERVYDAVAVITNRNSFHPVREAFEKLPGWDGVNRLDSWLKTYFEAEGPDEYLAQVFRKWLVAAVARIHEPGLKFDWMPIFEGAQGVGKSSIGRILAGDKYFLDSLPNLADKDAALGLQGTWFCEMGELASLRKNEIEVVKAFVSRQVDKVRPPYGKKWLESPRQCVFFGTTNAEQYLRDDTGNRRFNPVKVGRLDFEALRRDRDQLLAEAIFIYRNELDPELRRGLELEDEAASFALTLRGEKAVEDESTLMSEALLGFIVSDRAKPESERFNFGRFSISELFDFPGPLTRWRYESRNAQFAAKALKALGGKRRKLEGLHYWSLSVS